MNMILKVLGSGLVKRFLISAAEFLVKRTDNKLDDKILKELKKALA